MRYAFLVTLAFLLPGTFFAVHAQTGANDDTTTLNLPVRVHLLTSEKVSELNCTLSNSEVRELFSGANDVWRQAGIAWDIESIVREPAAPRMQDRFATLVQTSREVPRKVDRAEIREVVRNIYSTDAKLTGGWNLYVAEDLGRTIGGAYHAGSRSVLFAKHGPRGRQTAIVLAHELGHSLGLPHAAETLKDNLMMTASARRSPKTSTVLIKQQIAAARRQAALGRPYDVSQQVLTLFERNDANRDGAVTKDEARPIFLNNFATYDTNKDGRVELVEFQNSFDKTVLPSRSQPARTPVFDQYDQDSDGKLSKEEVGGYWERLARFDTNQDEVVDREEYAKAEADVTKRMRDARLGRFATADRNSDGKLSLAESQAAQRLLPPPLFDSSDQNRDGALDKKEFENALTRIRASVLPRKRAASGGLGRQPQRSDPNFDPKVDNPAFSEGRGPRVLLDEAHFNYHTVDGRYAPFAKLLRRDGYVVSANTKQFTRENLKGARVLVIANALAERNQRSWQLPTPSAFTEEEIGEIVQWVTDGGSLFLIADHMPFAGAAEDLGAAFGVRFLNGFALPKPRTGAMRFDRETKQLCDHAITRGRNEAERIDRISTFTGSAFQVGNKFQPILKFGPAVESLQPEIAWRFSDDTNRENVEGWCQGAVGQYGKGRLAIFGEAAMFSAQRGGAQGRPVGMNAPEAPQNGQLLLNTLHWLTGVLDAP